MSTTSNPVSRLPCAKRKPFEGTSRQARVILSQPPRTLFPVLKLSKKEPPPLAPRSFVTQHEASLALSGTRKRQRRIRNAEQGLSAHRRSGMCIGERPDHINPEHIRTVEHPSRSERPEQSKPANDSEYQPAGHQSADDG